MKQRSKRLLGLLILTVCYWFVALAFIGLSLVGDCFAEAAQCEADRRSVVLTMLTVEIAIYAFLFFSLSRQRSQTYWLLVTACLCFTALGYLAFGLGIL